jgi:glycyl-tRNA synthetase beta chain
MTLYQDFLVEIQTEELPPKSLLKLAEAFCQHIKERLQKIDLAFESIHFFATPRRLAVHVRHLASAQKEHVIERKGPARLAAFDAAGNASAACIGFARSCGVSPDELIIIKQPQGEWVGIRQSIPGKSVHELLPALIEQALLALPIAKWMRWGVGEAAFVRPVHSVLMLYGNEVMEATILGLKTGRTTSGHRFHAPAILSLASATDYAAFLEKKAHVIPDFFKRRDSIVSQIKKCLVDHLGEHASFVANEALINEVTGLVEWPVVLLGQFDRAFLDLPQEILISAMQDHQRYFPVRDQHHQLMEYFITVSNIESANTQRVIQGNERVLRARLSDAAFFYQADKKERLEARLPRLQGILFQAKLGTLYDKAQRLSKLADFIAKKWEIASDVAMRAGLLAKTDLTTHMVGEFPELQGIMGYNYALHDDESTELALAIKEHYLPRFAGDALPQHRISAALAIADRIDTLIGIFGIHQLPTGDKDPFALRRAALGIVRILIEKEFNLDLSEVLAFAMRCYNLPLENKDAQQQVLHFIHERMRAFLIDQGISLDVFAAVAALDLCNPLDVYHRIQAVQAFKQLSAAQTLSIANKRVSNIIAKYADTIETTSINPAFFEHAAEKELAQQLELKNEIVMHLAVKSEYKEILLQLADLNKPVDDFFEHVMVMTEDKSRRENRILLLYKLRHLFLKVADIALLQ